ncbi:hypothetical protein EUTSA_v10019339mg [Eutrema salsugineum]|uniref:Uncharacterized protein n=1 Tax=Eutrema salsugineum TaxID=72664 RepID=V4KFW3_EUTSA|nr:keratin, type II cytoskeletal 68 kDa, component IB [Eutrema salsugineum]ESQ28722.1 hypothetical protein EUTSA_v10019339mg [Eutrema salsugineum]
MRSDNLWTRKPEIKTGKSEFPVIRFLRGHIEKIKDQTGGPGIGGGLGCGAGIGFGFTGGLGLVASEGINHSNVVFGIGMGCGIGFGFGYGFGVGGGFNFDDIGDKLTYGKSSG